MALKFLLHFVGDLHQPLHASDNHDAGGNRVSVTASGFHAGNLHHYWDTEFVQSLGRDAPVVAQTLIAGITPADVTEWSAGTPGDWAMQSFSQARDHTSGKLPPPTSPGHYRLDQTYLEDAPQVVAVQLSRAGCAIGCRVESGAIGVDQPRREEIHSRSP